MGTYNIADVDIETVVQKNGWSGGFGLFSRRPVQIGEIQFEAKNITKANLVQDVSFSIRKGEIFGIGGLVGSGRSELVHLLFGAMQPDSGEIWLRGKKLTIRSPRRSN